MHSTRLCAPSTPKWTLLSSTATRCSSSDRGWTLLRPSRRRRRSRAHGLWYLGTCVGGPGLPHYRGRQEVRDRTLPARTRARPSCLEEDISIRRAARVRQVDAVRPSVSESSPEIPFSDTTAIAQGRALLADGAFSSRSPSWTLTARTRSRGPCGGHGLPTTMEGMPGGLAEVRVAMDSKAGQRHSIQHARGLGEMCPLYTRYFERTAGPVVYGLCQFPILHAVDRLDPILIPTSPLRVPSRLRTFHVGPPGSPPLHPRNLSFP